MTDPQLVLLNALASLVFFCVLAYWLFDWAATGRRPWDGTVFSHTVVLNERERDWDGD